MPAAPIVRVLALPLALAAVLVPTTAAAAAPAAKPLTLRIATTTKMVTIPASNSVGGVFADSQHVSAKCKPSERSVAPGLIAAPRPLAAQSFGFATVSAFATGQPGRVRFSLQALCASGGTGTSVITKRVEGKHLPGVEGTLAGLTVGRTTATASCGRGRVAIGAPLSQEFAPGFGRFSSRPNGEFGWQVQAHRVPDSLAANGTVPVYADVACISTKHVKLRQVVTKSTSDLSTATVARLSVPCEGARRPLGWGVDLRPYTTQPGTQDGRWLTPTVSKAQLTAKAVNVEFTLPEGAAPGADNGLSAADVTQTVYVVCGALTGK